MTKGELVTPKYCVAVHDVKELSYIVSCRKRDWLPDQPAVIVGESVQVLSGHSIPKIQILLDGELWWATAPAVGLKVMINAAW